MAYIKVFSGGCLNGSSAGKRRIAENIGSRMTPSFFVDDAKDTAVVVDRDILVIISAGATVFVVAIALIALRVCLF